MSAAANANVRGCLHAYRHWVVNDDGALAIPELLDYGTHFGGIAAVVDDDVDEVLKRLLSDASDRSAKQQRPGLGPSDDPNPGSGRHLAERLRPVRTVLCGRLITTPDILHSSLSMVVGRSSTPVMIAPTPDQERLARVLSAL